MVRGGLLMPAAQAISVEHVPIDQLSPDPANPRRISEEELEALTRSMKGFGFVQPVLARKKDGVVIGGHQRLVAARRPGMETVLVTQMDIVGPIRELVPTVPVTVLGFVELAGELADGTDWEFLDLEAIAEVIPGPLNRTRLDRLGEEGEWFEPRVTPEQALRDIAVSRERLDQQPTRESLPDDD